MKNLFFLFLLLSGYLSYGRAQNKTESKQITISGYIPDSYLSNFKGEAFITFWNSYERDFPESAQIIPITLINHKFSIKVMASNKIGYFSLGNNLIVSNFQDQFLIAQGDSIFMDVIDRKNVSFSGKGADKLNFQHWAGKVLNGKVKTWKSFSDPEIISYNKVHSADIFALTIDSLNKISPEWDDDIRKVFKMNTASAISLDYLDNIALSIANSDSTYLDLLKKELNLMKYQQDGLASTDPFVIENAFIYTKFLYKLNLVCAQLILRTKTKVVPFFTLYSMVKTNYSGLLRDKLITSFILFRLKFNDEPVKYLSDALGIVNDKNSKMMLETAAHSKLPGVKAYDFTVNTLDGKPIQLADFKGKILVIDTWYNGCLYCVELAKALEPIIQHFKNRKDVVFMSLNALDKDHKRAMDGVNSGKYGSKQSVYAWTNGLGGRHPLVLYYQYTSYPNLLVIGKDGHLIASNPDRPINEKAKQDFISLLEKNL